MVYLIKENKSYSGEFRSDRLYIVPYYIYTEMNYLSCKNFAFSLALIPAYLEFGKSF